MSVVEYFDIRTLVFITGMFRISSGLVVLAFPAADLSTRFGSLKRTQQIWGTGNLLIGAGIILNSLRSVIPDFYSINIGNTALVLGTIATGSSYSLLFKRKNICYFIILFGVFVIFIYNAIVFTAIENQLLIRSTLVVSYLFILEFIVFHILMNKEYRNSLSMFLALAHIILAIPMGLRLVELWFSPFQETLSMAVGVFSLMLGSALFSFVVTPAFVLLLKQLVDDVLVQNKVRFARETEAARLRNEIEFSRMKSAQNQLIANLAKGFAHDFNNILSTTRFGWSFLKESSALSPMTEGDRMSIRSIDQSIDIGLVMTKGILNIGEYRDYSLRRIDVSKLLADIEGLMRPLIPETVQLSVHIEDDCTVMTNEALLTNAIINIARNGSDAMPGGGELRIDVRQHVQEQAAAQTIGELQPGTYCQIAIADSGIGMSEELMLRIFTPRFSTNLSPERFGLGLFMVLDYVQNYGLSLNANSMIDRGTEIKLFLRLEGN